MPNWLRNILAVFAGVIVSGIVVGVVESVGHLIWPPPPGVDVSQPEALAALMDQIPLPAKLNVVLAWWLGAFVGAGVAAHLAGSRPAVLGYVVGAIQLSGGIATLLMIPHPAWMVVSALVAAPSAAFVAVRLVQSRTPSAA
jgi:hypothetical protein